MTYLNFRLLLLCLLFPPLLFILSVEAVQGVFLDQYLAGRLTRGLENALVGDVRPLLDGSVRIEERIQENVRRFLSEQAVVILGAEPEVTVLTRRGTILYPPPLVFQGDLMISDPVQQAARNLERMEEGLVVRFSLRLNYISWLSLLILLPYLGVSLFLLHRQYRLGLRRAREAEVETARRIGELTELEAGHQQNLAELGRERDELMAGFGRIKQTLEREKEKAMKNEDLMIEEIVGLEEKLRKNLALQEEQKEEIAHLKEQIQGFEQSKGGRSASRRDAMLGKRLRALYKNIAIHDRAVDGFTSLSEEMRIKAEEVVHQLNQDPSLVTIKRKVFGKKGRQTVLEVVYGYKGRLYFRKTGEGRVEVLVIGTKNSQQKDLEFLNNL
ncbi:MAG: hypothetical protein ACLFTV_13805 [Desulfococcaceae bacterium]